MNEDNRHMRSSDELISSQSFFLFHHAFDVLDAIRHGTHTRTGLVFATSLPSKKIDETLGLLVAGGLVSEGLNAERSEITRKGLRLLYRPEEMKRLAWSWQLGRAS